MSVQALGWISGVLGVDISGKNAPAAQTEDRSALLQQQQGVNAAQPQPFSPAPTNELQQQQPLPTATTMPMTGTTPEIQQQQQPGYQLHQPMAVNLDANGNVIMAASPATLEQNNQMQTTTTSTAMPTTDTTTMNTNANMAVTGGPNTMMATNDMNNVNNSNNSNSMGSPSISCGGTTNADLRAGIKNVATSCGAMMSFMSDAVFGGDRPSGNNAAGGGSDQKSGGGSANHQEDGNGVLPPSRDWYAYNEITKRWEPTVHAPPEVHAEFAQRVAEAEKKRLEEENPDSVKLPPPPPPPPPPAASPTGALNANTTDPDSSMMPALPGMSPTATGSPTGVSPAMNRPMYADAGFFNH